MHWLQVHITGLKGTEYLDSLDSRKRQPEEGDVLQFNGEVDRIYTSVPGNLQARIDLAAANEMLCYNFVWSLRATWCHGRPSMLQVVDEEAKHAIVIHRDKFVDAVVWCVTLLCSALSRVVLDPLVRAWLCVQPAPTRMTSTAGTLGSRRRRPQQTLAMMSIWCAACCTSGT